MPYPTDLRYTKDHEWVRLSGDVAEVGITDYAQQQLGDVVFVDLPAVGTKVDGRRGLRHHRVGEGGVGAVRAGQRRGRGAERGTEGSPEDVNTAPHETWMVRIQVHDASAVAGLLDAAQYEALLA